uniref:hypothetical protein n=1 Tax=Butyricimonas virosa TaxID=544645 RepID=UPI0040294502
MEKDKLNKQIDSILKTLSEEPGWELEDLYKKITGKEFTKNYDDLMKIEAILKSENIVEVRQGIYYITPKGIDIVNSGGYLKHKNSITKTAQLQHQKELLEIDQLKWNQRTRKQTIWISWIALFLSLVSIILTIIDKA